MGHGQHLEHRELAKSGGLSELAPVDVGTNKKAPDKTSDNSEKQKGNQLEKEPGFAVFHVEEDTVLISKRIDGLEDECSDESTEKKTSTGSSEESNSSPPPS